MSTFSRRDAMRLMLAGGAAAAVLGGSDLEAASRINSVVRGVQIGAQSYSFRDLPHDKVIDQYRTVGLGEAELWQGTIEPDHLNGAALRKWRLTVPLAHYHRIRERFDRGGVLIYAYNFSFRKDMTDDEMKRGFEAARALGVNKITASSNVSLAKRIDQWAQQYKITVGFHGHDQTQDPDEFSTESTFERALNGNSHYLGINLDIGHYVAANGDPVAFLKKWHDRIVTIHVKDRKKNHGPNEPFGQGDTPIVQVLQLIRDNHWKFPANIEYEYGRPGLDTITEMKKCYAYCRKALES
jgi:sugar phosphate isomerase/epimerase